MASQRAVLLTCDICRDEYDILKRKPLFLSCFHTFCLACLQETTGNTTIQCPTCKKESSIDTTKENMGLETNEKITAQLEDSVFPSDNFSYTEVQNEGHLWCLHCKSRVTEESDCVKEHTAMDLELAKDKIDAHFEDLLIKYKNQLGGHLTKHHKIDLALDGVQSALRALTRQADFHRKENAFEMKKLQKELRVVTSLLDSTPEEREKDKAIHTSIEKYSKLVEQTTAVKTTDFDRIRNSVVSLDIKTPDSQQLPTSLFNSAVLNFPSVGANELESHLLTMLSFLIFMSIQKGQRMTTIPPRKMSETQRKGQQTVNFQMDRAEGKEEAVGNEAEPTTQSKPIAPIHPSLRRSKSFSSNKPDSSGALPYRDYPKKEQQTCARPQKWERVPSNEQMGTKLKTFQGPDLGTIPPLMSVQTRKAFLALAVNGQSYGNIIIELQLKMAPIMCDKFVQCCVTKKGPSYQGTLIYQSKEKAFIMGGKIPGHEIMYMADDSPLKKTRGAIFFRLKRDYVKTQCSIVSTDFCIHLGEKSPDNHRTSTVFGYVREGLAVCDAISNMDCHRNHVAIFSAGLID
ncbi:uncharacterized protein LOC130690903 isoform X2 [Daphnia carinata]|uniref:uncharacterized protein LOC130690903 isoform X2 n=1 Tax=Daphnia carinata TaxID=120202 RepID=UPI00257F28FE|nr:uncharacterized protein LOC130690903 isoform X2 [Daphnia carinata]